MLKKFSSSYWGHIWKWLFRNLFNPLSQLVNRVFLLLDQTESIQSGGVHSVWGVEGKKSEGLGKWIMSLKVNRVREGRGRSPLNSQKYLWLKNWILIKCSISQYLAAAFWKRLKEEEKEKDLRCLKWYMPRHILFCPFIHYSLKCYSIVSNKGLYSM